MTPNRPTTPPNFTPYAPGTPRRRKVPSTPTRRVQGIRTRLPSRVTTPEAVQRVLKQELSIPFEPDFWQAYIVHCILQGYDGMCVAATGLGKSLVFEGTAKLAGTGQAALVVCPLKALERDQVGLDSCWVSDISESQLLPGSACLRQRIRCHCRQRRYGEDCRALGEHM